MSSEDLLSEKDPQQKVQLLDAARSVFQQHGFAKSSMDDIARQAGKSRTTLYKYYKNKELIFEDFVRSEIDAIVSSATAGLESKADLRSRLISYNDLKIEAIRKRLADYSRVISSEPENGRHFNFFMEQFSVAEKPVMRGIFRQAIREKEIKPIVDAELEFLVSVITLALRGIEREAFLVYNDDRLHERLRWLVSIMVKGLR